MSMETKIKDALEGALKPQHIEIINESYLHQGHAGDDGSGETHFKLKVVSSAFEGLSRVQRQRLVNNAINPLFENGLHSVSMSLECAGAQQKKHDI